MLSAMSYNKGYRCVYSLNIHKRASDKVPKKGHQPRNSFIGCMKSLPAMREKWGSKLTDFNGEPDHVHKRH
jgi:putative transposase